MIRYILIIILLIIVSLLLHTVDELHEHVTMLESNLHQLHEDIRSGEYGTGLVINNREHRGY